MASMKQVKKRLMEVLGPERAASYPHYLEQQFPHILENIVSQWGTPAMDGYFKELLVTARSDRHGFPPEAADEIFRLFSLHNALGPTQPKGDSPATGWDWVERLDYFEKSKGS